MKSLVASLVVMLFAVLALGAAPISIVGLPDDGNCSVTSIGLQQADEALDGGANNAKSIRTKIEDLQITGNVNSGINVSFIWSEPLFGVTKVIADTKDGNSQKLTGDEARRVFPVVYRCDVADGEWTIISPQDGSESTLVELNGETFTTSRVSFTDALTGVTNKESRYYYAAVTIVDPSDNPDAIANKNLSSFSDQKKFTNALEILQDTDGSRSPNYSEFLAGDISFIPEQSQIIYNVGNSSTDQTGIITATSTDLGVIDFGESVNQTFKTTTHQGDKASVTWGYTLSLDGTVVTTPDTLTFTATEDSLVIDGNYATTNAAPGVYTLTLTATYGSGTPVTQSFTWTLNPVAVDFTPIDVIGAVEIGLENAKQFTFTRSGGFSDPSAASFVTVNWAVSSPDSNLKFVSLTATGNQANFTISLPEDADLVGQNLNFTLTMTETCDAGAPPYCETMRSFKSRELKVTGLGHDFNFDTLNRDAEAAIVVDDENTYLPIYFNTNQQPSIENFTEYNFKAVNMKDGSTPVDTADFEIVSVVFNGQNETITGASHSVGGIKIETPASGTSDTATMSLDLSGTLKANDTFVVTLNALSATSEIKSTSITLRFITLESNRPTVIASAVLDDNTGLAYSWPAGFSSSAYPARTDARISVTFSEDVTNPFFQFGGSSSAVAFDNSATTSTSFTKVVTAGVLQTLLDSNATVNVDVTFSQAVDQINNVKKNTMIDTGPFVVTLAQTPVGTDHPEDPLERNESFSVALSEKVTGVNPSAIASTNLNNFSVSLNEDGDSLVISPLPGQDLAKDISATLTLNRGAFSNAAGYPNISTYVANLTFKEDLAAPVLQAVSLQSSDRLTNVTYVLTFNEVLSGSATVIVTDLTNGGNVSFDVVPSSNTLTISTAEALNDNTEYQFVVSNISDGAPASNKTTVILDAFITLGDDAADEIKDVNDAKESDETSPTILGISPNFDLALNQVNQPLRPLFKVAFSEYMRASTTESVVLTDTMNSTNGVGVEVVSFDGVNLVFYPSADLHSGEDYWLSFDINKAKDLKGNELNGKKYSFKTFSPNLGIKNDAPVSLGSNLNGVIDQGTKPRFYFNEPVDVSTLSSAISIKNAADELVGGLWAADGSDAVFNTDGLKAGGSYTYMFSTSRVADVLGKANALGVKKSGAFTVQGATRVRNFNVRVSDSGAATLNVTGSWLPPVKKTGITSFTLSYVKLTSTFDEGAESGVIGSTTGVSGARFTTSGVISNFTAGNSYRFKLTSNGTQAVEMVDVTAIPAKVAEVGSEFVSVLAHTSVEVGGSETAKITIKPGDLKGSAQITVAEIDDVNLKGQNGGGTKYSDIIQFEPHGLSFNRPVDFALKISTELSDLATSCGVGAISTCEAELLELLNPLTFDAANARWTGKGLAKTRVEFIDGQNALVHARTPHFSSFVIAQAFTFATTAPADGGTLATATIGQTTYVADILLTGTPNSQTVAVSFSPDTFGFESAFSGDAIRISNTNVQRPASDETASVTVTITVTDVSSDTTVVRAFSIPILDLSGDPDFTGTPVGVDFFRVSLVTDTSAKLTWALPESDKTSRTIDMVYIEYRDISTANSQTLTVSAGRGVSSTTVPVFAKKNYSWNIFTKSAQENRSDKATDIERFTYGYAQTTLNADNLNVPLSSVGVPAITISVTGINLATEAVDVSQFSAADISDLSDAKILSSTTTLQAPYGSVEFISGTLMDLNFGGASASVCYSVATTESLAVYHYVLNSNGSGYWEELPTSRAGGKVLAGLVNANVNCVGNTAIGISSVTIDSDGAGSPFAVGPKLARPVVIRSGGGGCSVVEGYQTSGSTALINLLVMLLPLLLIAVKRFK